MTYEASNLIGHVITYGAFLLHGTVQYGSLLEGFPLGTVMKRQCP